MASRVHTEDAAGKTSKMKISSLIPLLASGVLATGEFLTTGHHNTHKKHTTTMVSGKYGHTDRNHNIIVPPQYIDQYIDRSPPVVLGIFFSAT